MIWEGFFFAGSGYGEATRQYALALDALGVPVAARLAPSQDERYLLSRETLATLERLLSRRPARAGEVQVQQVLPPAFTVAPDAAASVGFTVFEADRIPQHWAKACNRMDEVWVPSQFCVESFARSGVKRGQLFVVPHGVEAARFSPGAEPVQIEGAHGFLFLSVFDWVKRKGWDVLLRAYLSEFRPGDDVCLVLRVSRLRPRELAEFIDSEFKRGPRPTLLVLPFTVPQELMPGLYTAADAFVVPSRGEGWGIPYGEAMASGLPVIATRWGGHLEFVTDENSYLVDVEGMERMDEETRARLGAEQDLRWARPSVDHLRQLMRRVYEHPDEARLRGHAARAQIATTLTWEQAAVRVWERADELGETGGAPLEALLRYWAHRDGQPDEDLRSERLAEGIAARMAELEQAEEWADSILTHLQGKIPPGLRQQRRGRDAR